MKENRIPFKRQFGVIIAESSMSNYNGDIDADNAPRTLSDGRGWISPPCIKHKIRMMIEDHKTPLWQEIVNSLDIKNPDHYHIFESPLKGFDCTTPQEAIKLLKKEIKTKGENIFLKYWDHRVFGATSLEGKEKISKGEDKEKTSKDKNKKTEKDDKNDSFKFKRTGCIQMPPLVSIDPVRLVTGTLTKANPLRKELYEKGDSDIAPLAYKVSEYDVFCGIYTINPNDAAKSNTAYTDIELFKFVLPHIFKFSLSALRSNMNMVKIYHASHESILGSFSESKFKTYCTPILKEGIDIPTSLDSYNIKSLDKVKAQFPKIEIRDLCN